jgi:hypothetical protein
MTTLYRFSWIFGLIGVLLAIAAGSLRFVLGELGTAGTVCAVGSGVSLIAWAALDRDVLERGARSRAFRAGAGSTFVAFVAAIVGVAFYVLVDRHDTKWDWTRAGKFSVSEQTLGVARALDRDVKILAFFRMDSAEERAFRTLADAYAQATDKIEVQIVDPLRSPRVASENGVTSEHGTVILQAGNLRQRLETRFDEEALTDALIRLTEGEDHRLCWATGHLEAEPDDEFSPGGLGVAVLKLEDRNFRFTKSDTLTAGIDATCEALVIAAPQLDWSPPEVDALVAYVAGGGRVFAMIEPRPRAEPGVEPVPWLPTLTAGLERLGVDLGDDLVLDPARRARMSDIDDPRFLVVLPEQFSRHPVTASLRATVLYGASRSASAVAGTPGLVLHDLVTAGPESWGETMIDVDPYENPNAWMPEEAIEKVGHVPVLTAVEVVDPSSFGLPPEAAVAPGGRVVVSGTADFARNVLIGRAGNQALFDHILAWLVDEPDQLGAPPAPEGDVLDVTLVHELFVTLLGVFLIPGTAAGFAILAGLRRRML